MTDTTEPAPGTPGAVQGRARWVRLGHQFIQFALVGASGVVVNMAVAFVMNKLHGGAQYARNPVWSWPGSEVALRYSYLVYLVSFLVANVWNYELNRRWTFRGTQRTWWRGFFPFLAAGIVGALVGFVAKVALTHPGSPLYLPSPPFSDSGWSAREYWGQLIGVLFGTPVNFIVNKLWAFRHHSAEVAAAAAGRAAREAGSPDLGASPCT